MKVHHIGVACKNAYEEAIKSAKVDGAIFLGSKPDYIQQVNCAFVQMKDSEYQIEYVSPLSGNTKLDRFIGKEDFYHIGYQVDSIEKALEEYPHKYKVLVKPVSAASFKRICFIYCSQNKHIVEFIEL